jgi:transposase-like protein
MTHLEDSNALIAVVELLAENGFEGMAEAMQILFNEAMKLQRSAALGAQPYQRSETRRGHANGFKPKTFGSRLGKLNLQIPQTRGVEFYPSVLERGERSERALKLAIAEMYVQGVSTRKVAAITEELCGLDVSSSQVSRASQMLDEELDAWRNRPLSEFPYLILDARYEKIRHGGSVVSCAVFVAIGITPQGKRSILGVSVSLSEAEVHWRAFLASLQERGLHGVRYIVSDDHAGLKEARQSRFSGVPWQRCQFHLQQNAMQYVPNVAMREQVGDDLRNVFNAPDRSEAERQLQLLIRKYAKSAPKLAAWLETDLPEGLTVFGLPAAHRRKMRTTNMLERINKELKRRTRVATLFPNEASTLRLVSAVLSEITEEWETGKIYLNMKAD